jgi:hypothetical protein
MMGAIGGLGGNTTGGFGGVMTGGGGDVITTGGGVMMVLGAILVATAIFPLLIMLVVPIIFVICCTLVTAIGGVTIVPNKIALWLSSSIHPLKHLMIITLGLSESSSSRITTTFVLWVSLSSS